MPCTKWYALCSPLFHPCGVAGADPRYSATRPLLHPKIWTTFAWTTLLKTSRKSATGVGIFRASDPCGCGERILFLGSDGQVHYDVHGLVSGVADHGNELRRHEPDHYVDRYWQTLVFVSVVACC